MIQKLVNPTLHLPKKLSKFLENDSENYYWVIVEFIARQMKN
jgi:hypothetical protein